MAGFGASDLRGLLGGDNEPSSSSHAGSFLPRVDASKKVSRLRAGVTPKWAADTDNEVAIAKGSAVTGAMEGEDEEVIEAVIDRGSGRPQASEIRANTATSAPAVVDRRLRLAASSAVATIGTRGDGEHDTAPRRRRIYEAEVIVEASSDPSAIAAKSAASAIPVPHADENMPAADALAARRARAKQAAQERENASTTATATATGAAAGANANATHWGERKTAVAPAASLSPSESGSSEYETDSDDEEEEEEAAQKARRPVFVPRAQRDVAYAAKAAEEEQQQERERARKKEQQQTSRQMVAEGLRRADAASVTQEDNEEDHGLPDDTDGVDPDKEYEEWELRELTRMQVDVERRKAIAAEAAELLRRRHRTDAEVEREREIEAERARANASIDARGPTKSHARTGVFYIDESSVTEGDVRLRDTSGLTSSQASRKGAEELRKKGAAGANAPVLGTASGRRHAREEQE